MTDFSKLWNEARFVANTAARLADARLGAEASRGFDCGFAWLTVPGNSAFGRWAKKEGIASKGYPSGLTIWYSKVHDVPTQSVSVHEAACRAARDVLAKALGEKEIGMASRLD